MRPASKSLANFARVNLSLSRRSLLTQSHSRGPTEVSHTRLSTRLVTHHEQPPLLEQTVGEHFRSVVSRYGDRTA